MRTVRARIHRLEMRLETARLLKPTDDYDRSADYPRVTPQYLSLCPVRGSFPKKPLLSIERGAPVCRRPVTRQLDPSPLFQSNRRCIDLSSLPGTSSVRLSSRNDNLTDEHDQNQLGLLGFGGQTGFAGTKFSRLGICTFGRLCASMTSVS